jgi:gamma-glutamylcysteine synthetase
LFCETRKDKKSATISNIWGVQKDLQVVEGKRGEEMNIEAQELADNIRATARTMRESAKKMRQFWRKCHRDQAFIHGVELANAARICDEWADAIEAVFCKGGKA